MNRRKFIALAAGAATVSALPKSIFSVAGAHAAAAPFELPKLPWADNALAPHLSANTIGFHYGKHHAGYVAKLNELVAGTPFADMPLDKVVVEAAKAGDKPAIFNAAAQTWNHTFYWNCLRAPGGGAPSGELKQQIEASFGDFAKFRTEFVGKCVALFGSGWTWLVADGGKLTIVQTKDADTPAAHGQRPVFTIDVWEHAYYLDYQNRRKDYVEALFDHLANWDFVAQNLPKG